MKMWVFYKQKEWQWKIKKNKKGKKEGQQRNVHRDNGGWTWQTQAGTSWKQEGLS